MLSHEELQLMHGKGAWPKPNAVLHPDVESAFSLLQEKAGEAGFSLTVASGFRDFDRQLNIWNRKARGEQAVFDDTGKPLNIVGLAEKERVFAILRWTALPGASRHHWGTDADVYDAAVMPSGYRLQLNRDEVADDGIFGKMHCWLDEQIGNVAAFGFFRPYGRDRGGIAPERWHLSYAPLAREFQRAFSLSNLYQVIEEAEMELKGTVLENLEEIYRRFIHVPYSTYPEEDIEW